MVDPLAKQLKGSGIPPTTVEHLQLDANAIARLSVRGLLPEGEVHKARKRLMKQIDAALSVPRP
jgi:FAD synthase